MSIIYDCEIINAIPQANEKRLSGLKYCEGWGDFENMGISVICAYDYNQRFYHVFLKDNFPKFQQLLDNTDLIIRFNNLAFDNPLCRANGFDVPDEKSWDLLAEIWAGAGLDRRFKSKTPHKFFGLNAMARANLGCGKSGQGALAPVDWQCSNYGAVIDYCLHDVELTKRLVDKVIGDGELCDPRGSYPLIPIGHPLRK